MTALEKTWALNQTTSDTISVATGVLAAATSDNVQALAILACESFGATLPMATETRSKVEKSCTRDHQSAVLLFLKAQVGYKRGDCAWQLAQSDAGVRFLGLAAAFLTLDSWTAASTLQSLIYNAAENKKMVPTTTQLQQILHAVEYKLSLVSFAESAVGWSIWLARGQGNQQNGTNAPSQRFIIELIEAMSKIFRLGSSETCTLEIKAPLTEAAWTIAFIKWCVETPTVVTNEENLVACEANRAIIVRILNKPAQACQPQIAILNDIREIKSLLLDLPSGLEKFEGMISQRAFGALLMQTLFGDSNSLPYRACIEALPWACLLVTNHLHVGNSVDDTHRDEFHSKGSMPDMCDATSTNIFPSQDRLLSVIHSFLGRKLPIPRGSIPGDAIIRGLPLIRKNVDILRQNCLCDYCLNTINQPRRKCLIDIFFTDISVCISVILCISLIHTSNTDGPSVFYGSFQNWRSSRFVSAVQRICFHVGRQPLLILLEQLIEDILRLFGHSTNDSKRWIMTSSKGQILCPKIFYMKSVQADGALCLECTSGAIWFKDEKYTSVITNAPSMAYTQSHSQSVASEHMVTLNDEDLSADDHHSGGSELVSPKNLFPQFRAVWQVSVREQELQVVLFCPDFRSLPQRSPRDAFVSVIKSILVNCQHDKQTNLDAEHTFPLAKTTPAQPYPSNSLPDYTIGVVQCDGNEAMRFFTMCTGQGGVIRGDACLECCIRCCQIAKLRFIIC